MIVVVDYLFGERVTPLRMEQKGKKTKMKRETQRETGECSALFLGARDTTVTRRKPRDVR